jgi:competence protein ComEC
MVDHVAGAGQPAPAVKALSPQARLRALCALAAEERDRWALWLPVVFGLGITGYFLLMVEPPPWLGAGATGVLFGGAWLLRSRQAIAALLLLCGIAAAGFGMAQLQAWRAAAPVLERQIGPVRVAGRILDLDYLVDGARVWLEPTEIGQLRASALPRRIRLHLKPGAGSLDIGQRIELVATLMPPPAPALPGGFDFQRQAYFQQLGAVGYAVGAARLLASDTDQRTQGFEAWVNRLRAGMTARIEAALPGGAGGIAAALITGERGAIPPAINQNFRDSGLAHILVIAGLHMTLVTGIAFFGIRAGLALVPWIALRQPIKKWAAAAALGVAFFYLLISGASVPAERAFVMCSLGLVAIIIDRLHVSLFGVAWAAWLVLLLTPVALVGVGFQMSFAAVVSLIAFYETYAKQIAGWRQGAGPIGRAMLYVGGICMTTTIATIGTAAFAIFHFNRFPLFSIVANLLAVPISGFWVMPWGMIGCALLPFGLESFGFTPMAWGIALIVAIANWTARLPSAVLQVPAMPVAGLVAITLGGLWLAIWRTRWRRWGFLPIIIGLASMLLTRPPDVLIAGDGKLLAVRSAAGGYFVSDSKTNRILREAWAQRALGVANEPWPLTGSSPSGATGDGTIACDDLGCIYRRAGHVVALPKTEAALTEDCRNADLIVTALAVRQACRARTAVIDRWDAWRRGTHAVWLGDTIRIESVDDVRGERPWVPRRPGRFDRTPPADAPPQ